MAANYADFAFNLAGQPTSLTRYRDLGGTQKVGRSAYSYDLAGRLTTIYQKRANDATFATYQCSYRSIRFVRISFGALIAAFVATHVSASTLEEDFQNPPVAARPSARQPPAPG